MMSYSFTVRGPTKRKVLAGVVEKFDAIVLHQPKHEADRAAVLANATSALCLLADDETKDYMVSCNGYLSWHHDLDDALKADLITSASISVHAGLMHRATEPA
jgi:hypothetical protein